MRWPLFDEGREPLFRILRPRQSGEHELRIFERMIGGHFADLRQRLFAQTNTGGGFPDQSVN